MPSREKGGGTGPAHVAGGSTATIRYDTAVVAPANFVVRGRGGSQKSWLTICQWFVFLIENEEKPTESDVKGAE